MEVSGQFFFCLVLLEKKINVIHGGFGSTWEHNFYMACMGTQNGSKLEIRLERILIHAFELRPLKFSHTVNSGY